MPVSCVIKRGWWLNKGYLLDISAYQRLPFRLANKVLAGFNSAGFGRVEFTESALLDTARKETGLTDFGDTSFLEGLNVLCTAIEEAADLNPIGRHLTTMSLVRLLKNRLYAQYLLTRHPEILDRQLVDPVVILGLPRSGTTRLHRLLAADDQFLHLKTWESLYPAPYPECFGANIDPRIQVLDRGLKAVLYLSPQINAVHPMGTYEVEEELGLLQHGFSTQIFEICMKVPGFSRWLESRDQTPAYEYNECFP